MQIPFIQIPARSALWAPLLVACALLAGCGGGGGGGETPAPGPAPAAPQITSQPQSVSVMEGGTATFTVAATGDAPLSYQWLRNGASIAGATSSTYSVSGVQRLDSGAALAVRISNTAGSVTSQTATLTVTPGAINTLDLVAGNITALSVTGSYPPLPVDGTNALARFGWIRKIAVDADGNVLVAEPQVVRKISAAGVVTLAGAAGISGYADGPGATARFDELRGLALDGAGNAYLADSGNAAIRKMSPAGVVSTLAGGVVSTLPDKPWQRLRQDGPLAQARFGYPLAVAADAHGNLYVLDAAQLDGCLDGAPGGAMSLFSHFAVRKITAGGTVTTLSGSTVETRGMPGKIAVDGQGNVFVSMIPAGSEFILGVGCGQFYRTGKAYVMKITSGGGTSIVAGSDVAEAGFMDGPGATARFRTPLDIAVDADGALYVADADNRAIRRIDAAGNVSTVVGQPPTGFEAQSGEIVLGPLPGQLRYADSLAIGPANEIYISTGTPNGRIVLKAHRR